MQLDFIRHSQAFDVDLRLSVNVRSGAVNINSWTEIDNAYQGEVMSSRRLFKEFSDPLPINPLDLVPPESNFQHEVLVTEIRAYLDTLR